MKINNVLQINHIMFSGKQMGQELCFLYLIAYFLVGRKSEREVAFWWVLFFRHRWPFSYGWKSFQKSFSLIQISTYPFCWKTKPAIAIDLYFFRILDLAIWRDEMAKPSMNTLDQSQILFCAMMMIIMIFTRKILIPMPMPNAEIKQGDWIFKKQ